MNLLKHAFTYPRLQIQPADPSLGEVAWAALILAGSLIFLYFVVPVLER